MDVFDEVCPKARARPSQQLAKQGYIKLTQIESFILEELNSEFEYELKNNKIKLKKVKVKSQCGSFTPSIGKKYPIGLYDTEEEKFVSLGDIFILQFKEKKQLTFSIGTKKYQVDKLEKDGGVLVAIPFKGTKVRIVLKPRAIKEVKE